MAYKSKYRIDDVGRECSRCKKYKTWEHFGKNRCGTNGYQCWCKNCFHENSGYKTKQKKYTITNEGRECSECGTFKAWAEFHIRKDLSTGRSSACKICTRARTRRNMDNGKIRNTELKRKYGIDLEEYKRMAAEQGDACAICGTTEKGNARGRTRYWSVDHDHKTGKVRALLCQKCNALLGLAHDDIFVLQRAIKYLEKYSE